jgi:tetratricopeptide (TPR) repeat protein
MASTNAKRQPKNPTKGFSMIAARISLALFVGIAVCTLWNFQSVDSSAVKTRNVAADLRNARHLRESGDRHGAAKLFRQVLKVDDSAWSVHHELSDTLKEAGDLAGAVAVCEYLAKKRGNAEDFAKLAELYQTQGRLDDCISTWRKVGIYYLLT